MARIEAEEGSYFGVGIEEIPFPPKLEKRGYALDDTSPYILW